MPGGQKRKHEIFLWNSSCSRHRSCFLDGWRAEDKSASSQKPAGGEAVYQANRVLCHGSDGHAETPLGKQMGAHDLHSAEVQEKN